MVPEELRRVWVKARVWERSRFWKKKLRYFCWDWKRERRWDGSIRVRVWFEEEFVGGDGDEDDGGGREPMSSLSLGFVSFLLFSCFVLGERERGQKFAVGEIREGFK